MNLLSSLVGIFFLFLSLCFALSNRQSVTMSLWPFGMEATAPLFILTLGLLLVGLLLGGLIVWFSLLPHHLTAWRLRKENTHLHKQLAELQQMVIPMPEETPAAKRSFLLWKK